MKGIVAFYPTNDVTATRQFYEDILKLSLFMDQGNAVIYDTGYGYLGFCDYQDQRSCEHVCISFNKESVAAVDYAYEQLPAAIQATKPAMHPHFPVYSFFFKDNNGYTLEIQYINTIKKDANCL